MADHTDVEAVAAPSPAQCPAPGVGGSRPSAPGLLLPSLRVVGFRGLKDVTVPALARVNLFTGPNCVGKTSLLEAIWLLLTGGHPAALRSLWLRRQAFAARAETDVPFDPDRFRLLGPTVGQLFHGRPMPGQLWHDILLGTQDRSTLRIRFHMPGLVSSEDYPDTLRIPDHVERAPAEDGGGDRPGDAYLLVYWNSHLFPVQVEPVGRARPSHQDAALLLPLCGPDLTTRSADARQSTAPCLYAPMPMSGPGPDAALALWDRLVPGAAVDDILAAVRLVAPSVEQLAAVETSAGRRVMAAVAGHAMPCSLSTLGDGVERVFRLALALASARGGMVVIDGFDSGLDEAVLTAVWRFVIDRAERWPCQVFAAATGSDAARALAVAGGCTGVARIFRCERGSQGVTVRVQRLPEDDTESRKDVDAADPSGV